MKSPEQTFIVPLIDCYLYRICPPDWSYPRKKSVYQYLVFITSGRGEFVVDGVRHPVTKGQLVNIKLGAQLEAMTEPADPLRYHMFGTRLYDNGFEPVELPLPTVSTLPEDPRITHLLERVRETYSLRETTCHMQMTALLMEIISQVMLRLGLVKGISGEPRVEKSAAYVVENVHRRISAAELGKAAGIHPGYLNKLTMRFTGKTVSQFITSIRVNMAEDAIVDENLTVSEAAARHGFSDIYHFSKVFKKYKGYPPSTAKTKLR